MAKIESTSFQNLSISHCCFLSPLKFINLFNKYLQKPLSVPGAVPGQLAIVVILARYSSSGVCFLVRQMKCKPNR